jgi:hypothetical protein
VPLGETRTVAGHHRLQGIREVDGLQVGAEGAALDAAEVEQVGDQAVEVLGLAVDGLCTGQPIRLRHRVGTFEDRARRGADGGQRGSQVVGDRVQ